MTAVSTKGHDAREMLKILSEEVTDLVEAGTFNSINDAILETLYKNGVHREFKSYREWQRMGFQVRKGEKAFLLWARPKDIELQKEEAQEPSIVKYFPLAYVFSNAQVEPQEEPNTPSEPPEPELEPLPYE